jgi:hypothetical protein
VTAGVTLRLTDLVSFCGLVRLRLPAPARLELVA